MNICTRHVSAPKTGISATVKPNDEVQQPAIEVTPGVGLRNRVGRDGGVNAQGLPTTCGNSPTRRRRAGDGIRTRDSLLGERKLYYRAAPLGTLSAKEILSQPLGIPVWSETAAQEGNDVLRFII